MPESDLYLPLHVGAEGKESILAVRVDTEESGAFVSAQEMTRDDSGENISAKNPMYCELTGLYWMWKNLDAEYCGLVHYRRLFYNPKAKRERRNPYAGVLDREHLELLLETTDIIFPKKRNYYIESIYSHYAHSHYPEHLDVTREILSERCPEYLESFDRLMKGKKAHMFNMAIMRKDKLDKYCEWLFPILEELERRIDSSAYDDFQKRYPGRVSELLINVWADAGHYSYAELPVRMQGEVKWVRKIASFLGAKFFKRKYQKGF